MPRKSAQAPVAHGVTLEPACAAPSTFTDGGPLPKILIFDLDYTLWPFWVDTHVSPPLKATAGNRAATDRSGESFTFYKDVPSILHAARAASIPVALASRTHAPELALKLLSLLHVPAPNDGNDKSTEGGAAATAAAAAAAAAAPKKAVDFFDYKQIFPGDKKTHMNRINKESGIAFEDMLFFDDESRNRNVEALGVTFWLVRDGTTRVEVDRGVEEWRKRKGG